jgi:hypothetical protein
VWLRTRPEKTQQMRQRTRTLSRNLYGGPGSLMKALSSHDAPRPVDRSTAYSSCETLNELDAPPVDGKRSGAARMHACCAPTGCT